MFNYLNGIIAEVTPSMAVVDCGGVGYEVTISAYTAGQLTVGEKHKVYISFNFRQDGFSLFGFADKSEKQLFEMLITVTGVGPKAAISILSTNTCEALAMAIVTGDEKAISSAPGIGKKTAQRIILELKDKISKQVETISFSDITAPKMPQTKDVNVDQAISALAVLGYGSAEINKALSSFDCSGMDTNAIIKMCLKFFSK